MKTLFKKGLCLLVTLCMVLSLTAVFTQAAEAADSKPTVFVIGDSTAERNVISSANTENRNGWGQVLYNYFKDTCIVWNWANSGESTRRLYNTWWKSIAGKISAGDYVLIQLGHNDGGRAEVWTDPLAEENAGKADGEYVEGSYKWYLNYYAETIRSKDAYPIFVTSIERQEDAALEESRSRLYNYVNAMKKVGQVENVPVIDVWTDFRALCGEDKLGTEGFANLFISDKIHINRTGAMTTAKIFAENLKKSTHEDAVRLASYLVDDIATVTDAGVPTPQLSEDFNGAYTDGETIGFPMNYWRLEASGTPIKNKTVKYSLQSGNDFAATFTSRKATEEEISAYDYNDKVEGDPEKPGTPYTNKMENYLVRHTFEKPITEGYVKYSFRMKQNAGSDSISMRVGGFHSDTHYINLSDNKYLPLGSWHTFDFYLDIANKKLLRFVDGKILQLDEVATVSELHSVWFGLARTIDADAEVTVDDISLTYIDEQTFAEKERTVKPVLPSNVYIKENFENGFDGDAISSVLSPGWTYSYSSGYGGPSYTPTYWEETGVTPANTAMLFTNSDATKQSLTYTTNTLATPVTSGYIHIGWRMQSVGTSSGADCYFNPSEYNGQITISTDSFESGKWYNLNAYINLSTKEFTLYRGKAAIYKNRVIDKLASGLTSVGFSMYRIDNNYQIAFDDIIVETISQADYNDATGVLAENVIFSEKGNFVESGTALATSATEATNAYSNFYAPSDNRATTWIKFADSPTDSSNTALNFGRSIKSPQNGAEIMKRDISPAITDGFYSLALKLYSKGTNNTRFNIGAVDDAGQSCSIGFNFAGNTIVTRTFYPTSAGLSSAEGTTNVSYVEGWNDIELLFDLRATDHCKLTIYLNGVPVISNASWGYYPEHTNTVKNNGSIKQIYMGVPGDTSGSNAPGTNRENGNSGAYIDPADVSWFADDIVLQPVVLKTNDITVSDGKLVSVELDFGWLPTASQKVVVAVYDTDENGNITVMNDVQILTAEKGVQALEITDDIPVDTGDVVKVFIWNMNKLEPINTEFIKSID